MGSWCIALEGVIQISWWHSATRSDSCAAPHAARMGWHKWCSMMSPSNDICPCHPAPHLVATSVGSSADRLLTASGAVMRA